MPVAKDKLKVWVNIVNDLAEKKSIWLSSTLVSGFGEAARIFL